MAAHPPTILMPVLTKYTSYDEIRAVLGVSDEELEDTTLALPIYMQTLQFALGDLEPTLEAQYLAAKANPTPSTQEQRLIGVVSVYSAYAISHNLLTSLPLFAPRMITDGRAQTERVADPFEGVREGVNAMLAVLRARIAAALAALGTAVVPAASRNYFAVSSPNTDIVTNT